MLCIVMDFSPVFDRGSSRCASIAILVLRPIVLILHHPCPKREELPLFKEPLGSDLIIEFNSFLSSRSRAAFQLHSQISPSFVGGL